MRVAKENRRYPENLALKAKVALSGQTVSYWAMRIGCSREVLSNTINGNYKGVDISKRLEEEMSKEQKEVAELRAKLREKKQALKDYFDSLPPCPEIDEQIEKWFNAPPSDEELQSEKEQSL